MHINLNTILKVYFILKKYNWMCINVIQFNRFVQKFSGFFKPERFNNVIKLNYDFILKEIS